MSNETNNELSSTAEKKGIKKILSKIGQFFKKLGKPFKKIGKFIKKHKVISIVLIVLIAVGAFLSKKFLFSKNDAADLDTATVTTTVTTMDLQSSISVTGTLSAGQSQDVTSTTATGTEVSAVYYEVGDYVEAGEVVVEFDSDDYEEALAELNAKYNISDVENEHTLEDYQSQIEDKQEEIADVEEDIAEVQEYLDEWADVYNNLVDAYNDYLEYGDTDSSVASRWTTESNAASVLDDGNGVTISGYEDKQDELEELQDSIEDIQDEITELQYQYDLAVLNQEYESTYTKSDEYDSITESQSGTQVVAPFSGYITAINVEEGNNYTQGETVFTIANTDSFVVEATVDEYDIASISEGLSAVVKFDATDDEEFSGTVTYVAVTSSSSDSSSTASYDVEITLDSTDDRLRVGMTAKASVVLESAEGVYAVAYDCVETDADGNSYITAVDDDGNETKITVTTGLESDYYVEIQSDELYDGMTVKATASSATTSDSSDESSEDMMNMGGGDMGGGDMGGGGGQGGAPGGM